MPASANSPRTLRSGVQLTGIMVLRPRIGSVERELGEVGFDLSSRHGFLVGFSHEKVSEGQDVDARGEESSIGILGRLDDRLASHVEARVDQDRAAGPSLESPEQPGEERVPGVVDCLHPCRAVDVGDGRDRASGNLELVDPEEVGGIVLEANPAVGRDGGDDQHVRAVRTSGHVEIVVGPLGEDGGGKGAERLAELDLEVHRRLHLGVARVAQQTPRAKRAGAKLHPTLEPADDLAVGQMLGDRIAQGFVVLKSLERGVDRSEEPLDLGVGVTRAKEGAGLTVGLGRGPGIFEKLMVDQESHAERPAGIPSGWLDPEPLERAFAEDQAVRHAVERDPSSQAEVR